MGSCNGDNCGCRTGFGYCGERRCPPGMRYSKRFGGCVFARDCNGDCPPGTVCNDITGDCVLPRGCDGKCPPHSAYNVEADGCIVDALPSDERNPSYPWYPGFPYPGYPGTANTFGGYAHGYPQFPFVDGRCDRDDNYGFPCAWWMRG